MESQAHIDHSRISALGMPSQLGLLLALVLLQVGQSFLSDDNLIQRSVFNLLFLIVVISAIRALTNSQTRMFAAAVAGVAGYILASSAELTTSRLLLVATQLCYVFMFVLLMLSIAESVFGDGPVDLNRILGAANIYLILGLVFALLFTLLEILQPGAFDLGTIPAKTGINQSLVSDLIYFSNSTLTTLGYGDVVPISRPARTLATLEAILGQLYLAVVMARLVGLHIAQRGNSRTDHGQMTPTIHP